MKIYKSLLLLSFGLATLVLTRCGLGTSAQDQTSMELQQPSFVNSPAHFNTYVAGVQSGGQGIEFYLAIDVHPADVVLEKVYFRESVGKLLRGNGNYVARFRTDTGKGRDLIMSGNTDEEAVNTPPAQVEKFPLPLTRDEAGISYREKGVLKYAKISNVKETEGIAYPSAPPGDKGS